MPGRGWGTAGTPRPTSWTCCSTRAGTQPSTPTHGCRTSMNGSMATLSRRFGITSLLATPPPTATTTASHRPRTGPRGSAAALPSMPPGAWGPALPRGGCWTMCCWTPRCRRPSGRPAASSRTGEPGYTRSAARSTPCPGPCGTASPRTGTPTRRSTRSTWRDTESTCCATPATSAPASAPTASPGPTCTTQRPRGTRCSSTARTTPPRRAAASAIGC